MITNNKELIDRARLRANYLQYGTHSDQAHGNFLKELADALENTEHSNSVKHGHWESADKIFGGIPFKCSICGEETRETVMGEPKFNYCPNCGAKMEKGTIYEK